MTLPSRLSFVLLSLAQLRPYTRTDQSRVIADLDGIAIALNDIVHSDLSDAFADGSDTLYVGFCSTLERLRDNLLIARQNLAMYPGTMEGYIDGARIELEQLKAKLETTL